MVKQPTETVAIRKYLTPYLASNGDGLRNRDSTRHYSTPDKQFTDRPQ